MPRDLERAVIGLVRQVYRGEELPTPEWLQRPAAADAGRRWKLVQSIHASLTDMQLPDAMPPRERRDVDCVLQRHDEASRIIEFDETQHFNDYRAQTIRRYPRSVSVAFDRGAWLRACDAKRRLEGQGFGRPKPPLFPHEDGRHRQRAFRDALADILPADHGWLPTLRIADFEKVAAWSHAPGAQSRISDMLDVRLGRAGRGKTGRRGG
jgi:hypothetical protein